jgi:DNA-binding transcriptional regulator YdaS (Cro superfamily)
MLKSVDAVIAALGGPTKMAALTGVGPSAVINWRTRREIPAEYFVLICEALEAAGKGVERSVFGFNEARA